MTSIAFCLSTTLSTKFETNTSRAAIEARYVWTSEDFKVARWILPTQAIPVDAETTAKVDPGERSLRKGANGEGAKGEGANGERLEGLTANTEIVRVVLSVLFSGRQHVLCARKVS